MKRLTSILACSSALASGAGTPRIPLSRVRGFFAPSACVLPAALSLQSCNSYVLGFFFFYKEKCKIEVKSSG